MNIINTTSFEQATTSPYALGLLSLLSFSESSFFIIPPEVLLIPLAIANPESAIMLGLLTSFTSILGALFGYLIGQKGGKPILKKFFSPDKVDKVKILFNKYDAWAILVAAFTPIPFKISTISAGAFDINLKRFIIASSIGRSTRYMLISILIYFFGEPIKDFILNDLGLFMLIGTLIIIAAALASKLLIPAIEKKFLKETIKEKLFRVFSNKR